MTTTQDTITQQLIADAAHARAIGDLVRWPALIEQLALLCPLAGSPGMGEDQLADMRRHWAHAQVEQGTTEADERLAGRIRERSDEDILTEAIHNAVAAGNLQCAASLMADARRMGILMERPHIVAYTDDECIGEGGDWIEGVSCLADLGGYLRQMWPEGVVTHEEIETMGRSYVYRDLSDLQRLEVPEWAALLVAWRLADAEGRTTPKADAWMQAELRRRTSVAAPERTLAEIAGDLRRISAELRDRAAYTPALTDEPTLEQVYAQEISALIRAERESMDDAADALIEAPELASQRAHRRMGLEY